MARLKLEAMRELRRNRLSFLKAQAAARKIMPSEKLESLRADLKELEAQFARDISRKDGIIQQLIADLERSEEQHVISKRSHLRSLDNLNREHEKRIAKLDDGFDAQVKELKLTFADEVRLLEEEHEEEVLGAKHLSKVLEERQEQLRQEMAEEFEQRKNQLQSSALERIHQLQNVMDGIIDSLSSEFDEAHSSYIRSADQRTILYKDLKKKDTKHTRKIKEMKVRADHAKSAVQRYRVKLANMTREEEGRIKALEGRKLALLEHHRVMREATRKSRQRAQKRLRHLSNAGTAARARLASTTEIGERILGLSERCKELESHVEKVDPFRALDKASQGGAAPASARDGCPAVGGSPAEDGGAAPPYGASEAALLSTAKSLAGLETAEGLHFGVLERATSGEGSKAKASADGEDGKEGEDDAPAGDAGSALEDTTLEGGAPAAGAGTLKKKMAFFPSITDEDGAEVDGLDALKGFYERVNKALLERIALSREKERLAAESSRLRSTLEQFLKGISLSEQTLKEANTLLTVGDPSLAMTALATPGGLLTDPPSLIEGSLHMRSTARGPRE